MIEEFVSLVKELFPSITPYTAQMVQDSIKQFRESGQRFQCFMTNTFDFLAQGDIIDSLPFVIFDSEGRELRRPFHGLLISNTCSADHDKAVIFAPLLPLSMVDGEQRDTLISNKIYRLLYFPDYSFPDYVVDLSLLNTFPVSLINNLLKNGRLRKIGSLNTFGYYLLIAKLTAHLMRPEDLTAQAERYKSA